MDPCSTLTPPLQPCRHAHFRRSSSLFPTAPCVRMHVGALIWRVDYAALGAPALSLLACGAANTPGALPAGLFGSGSSGGTGAREDAVFYVDARPMMRRPKVRVQCSRLPIGVLLIGALQVVCRLLCTTWHLCSGCCASGRLAGCGWVQPVAGQHALPGIELKSVACGGMAGDDVQPGMALERCHRCVDVSAYRLWHVSALHCRMACVCAALQSGM